MLKLTTLTQNAKRECAKRRRQRTRHVTRTLQQRTARLLKSLDVMPQQRSVLPVKKVVTQTTVPMLKLTTLTQNAKRECAKRRRQWTRHVTRTLQQRTARLLKSLDVMTQQRSVLPVKKVVTQTTVPTLKLTTLTQNAKKECAKRRRQQNVTRTLQQRTARLLKSLDV